MLPEGFQFERSTANVSDRQAAIAWFSDRVRKVWKIMVVAVVVAPIASAALVIFRHMRRSREFPPVGPLLGAVAFWSVLAIALMAIVAFLLTRKYMAFGKRAGPIIQQGEERSGTVVNVAYETRQAGGVAQFKEILTIELDGGETVTAALEYPTGTKLPQVDTGADATVWTHNGSSVVATSGALFEST